MSRYIEFDPQDIEDEIYQRLDERLKDALANPKIIKEINVIRMRKAQKILEDDEVNILNFQMFQYALKLLKKEKKQVEKKEEEERKKQEELANPGKQRQGAGSLSKLILVNMVFFLVVAGGIFFASGSFSLLGLFGGGSMYQAKKEDTL